jgi:hypothetical protein
MMGYLKSKIEEKLGNSYFVYCARANRHEKSQPGGTLDGIHNGALRISNEVKQVISAHAQLSDISVIGFSLGGLFARYFIALNFHNNLVCGLKPGAFLTIATPHLGVRNLLGPVANWVKNYCV